MSKTDIPCKNCITFPVCRNATTVGQVLQLSYKCQLLDDFVDIDLGNGKMAFNISIGKIVLEFFRSLEINNE